MRLTRTSLLTGIERTLDIDVTEEQLTLWLTGTVAQVAFAHLSKEDREFIISGCVQEEWDTLKAGEEGPNDELTHYPTV